MADKQYLRLYVPVIQAVCSYWIGEIPLPQSALILYINERTLRYGKPAEYINRTHFLDGVSSNGHLIHNGVHMKHTALWNNLKALEDRELLHVVHMPRMTRGNVYQILTANVLAPVSDGALKSFSKTRVMRRRGNSSTGEGLG